MERSAADFFETLVAGVDSLFDAQQKSITMAYYDQRINLLKTEYSLEKSNINVGLPPGAIPSIFALNRAVIHGVWAWGLPYPSSTRIKGDMAKRKIELMEEEQEKQELSLEDETGSVRTREQIKSQLARYQEFRKRSRP